MIMIMITSKRKVFQGDGFVNGELTSIVVY